MRGTPFKIFIAVLMAGLIGIAGEIFLVYHMNRLADGYSEILTEHIVNSGYIKDISGLLYKHQAITANHIAADSEELYDEYEAQAKEIEEQLNVLFDEFGKRMTGDKREQLFHLCYSDYRSYLQNAEVAFKFSREGSTATASYYVVNVMYGFVETVNEHLDDLHQLAAEEMQAAADRMDGYIAASGIVEKICITGIIAAVTVCIILCVRITSGLDRHKKRLEIEVEEKTGDLRRHNEKMLELQNNIIIAMANLIESRDGDTGEHVKRTSKYVTMLAEAAKKKGLYPEILTDSYVELLAKAAPMHDIGKISVPDSILQKPGKLTPEEFERIKSHAPEGGRIIREVMDGIEEKEYVDIAATVAEGHHEKWDGGGYPSGLKGDEIPLSARIMAIADVFDALISKRCYKEAMPLDEAFGIISDSAGTHFDPELAGIFISLRPEIEEYLSEK
ncbi:HD domain-containing phosphohydrolase [Huintestinicola sp.]|uniref:HD domain-containing phosphohydrolase n=1 Tax=Huintestinicola sp. TaxID=2981661 RepID=UPI003D7EF436